MAALCSWPRTPHSRLHRDRLVLAGSGMCAVAATVCRRRSRRRPLCASSGCADYRPTHLGRPHRDRRERTSRGVGTHTSGHSGTSIFGVIELGFVRLPATRLFVMVATIVSSLVAIALFLKRTKAGVALRAAGENPEAASLRGVPWKRTHGTSRSRWATLLAALAGPLIAMILPVEPILGDSLLVIGFIALIVGGAGSPLGAVVGGLLIGPDRVDRHLAVVGNSRAGAHLLPVDRRVYFRPTGIISTAQGSRL
ncbi:branched-chain amino acid ABC transporter permease [Rhodococcus opacus]|nr:branched-chain amino acid ABC transporter permease [Rhodococcus opacus]